MDGNPKQEIADSTHVVREHRSNSKKWRLLVLLSLSAILLSGGAFAYFGYRNSLPPFPEHIITSVDYPIYYPQPMPEGFQIDKTSIASTSGIVTYAITFQEGIRKLAITVQKIPNGFDDSILSGTDEFNTNYGKAYIVDLTPRTTGSLLTNDAWVIINTTDSIGTDQMHEILNNLKPIN